MELDELQNMWSDLSKKIDTQNILTRQMIQKMTEQRYRTRLTYLTYPEIIGSLICLAGAFYLFWNFERLDQFVSQVFAGIAIALLIVLPVLSFKSLSRLKNIPVAGMSYSEAIRQFSIRKIKFQKLQKLNASFGLSLLVVMIPVLADLKDKDLSASPYFWTLIFPLGVIFQLTLSWWVLRYYNKALTKAEESLSELDT